MGRRGRPPYPDILTPREWEVLALLREGLTNEAIADRLGVTYAAAKYHVSEILSKLGVATREAAAAWEPEAAREPQLRRWWGVVGGWLRPVTVGKAALIGAAVAVVAGIGVLAWGVLRDAGEDGAFVAETETPAPSATAASNVPSLAISVGMAEFAASVDNAMHSEDASFFTDNTLFRDYYRCDTLAFPAAGPNCAAATVADGKLAIVIGALSSEGDVFDPVSYEAFIQDLLTNVNTTVFDDFGRPAPRVYAVADLDPVVEGQRPEEETYSVITTRVAGPPSDTSSPVVIGGPDGQRVVVTFFVTSTPGGWRITGLSRMGTYILDPAEAEAVGMGGLIKAWTNWADPGITSCKGSVTGRLILGYGSAAAPAPGEWITISGMPGDPLGEQKRTQTANDGTFRVDGLPIGYHVGSARHATFEFSVGSCDRVVNVGDILYPLTHPGVWPADSQLPAAGVCLDPTAASLARIDLEEGTPAPRCAKVLNGQKLRFTNKTDQAVEVQLGNFYETLDPGATSTRFEQLPVSGYLAPGVHVVHASPYEGSGLEIWLTEPAPSPKR